MLRERVAGIAVEQGALLVGGERAEPRRMTDVGRGRRAPRRKRLTLKSRLKSAVETGRRSASGTMTRSWRSLRHRVQSRDALGRERRVAGEQLVAAIAPEGDRHRLAREPREDVRRQDRGVCERLVEEIDNGRQHVDHRLRREHLLVVVGAEVLGDATCVRGLVEAPLAEPDRERLHVLRRHCSTIIATTELESMPPLRNAPSGTSLIEAAAHRLSKTR